MSKIEWTDVTWNPVTGCTPVSPGCDNCYARRMAKRLAANPKVKHQERYEGFRPTVWPERLEEPLQWERPRRVFVASMGDLFHEDFPTDYIREIYDVMRRCAHHTFIVLTKRPERIIPILYGKAWDYVHHFGGGNYLPNVWHLVTAENQEMADKRIPELLKLREMSPGWPVLGVSIEPMLGRMDISDYLGRPHCGEHFCEYCGACLSCDGEHVCTSGEDHIWPAGSYPIDWVIVGGETGPGARPMKPEWVRSIRGQCSAAGTPFFFKQWGGGNKNRLLDGRMYEQLPGGNDGQV